MSLPTDATSSTTSPDPDREPPHETSPPAPRHGFARRTLTAIRDHFAETCVTLVWPVLSAIVLGANTWWLLHLDKIDEMASNRFPAEMRSEILVAVAISFGVVALLYATRFWFARRENSSVRPMQAIRNLNWLLLPLLASPFVLILARPKFEASHPQTTVFFALVASVFSMLPVARFGVPRFPFVERLPPWLSKLSVSCALVVLWFAYGLFFSHLSITNHHGMHTHTFDLALYDNIFYQTLRGKLLGCSFLAGNYHGSAHFDPILILLSPFYLFYQRAESILVLQSFWLGSGIIPVYLLARRTLSRPWALLFSCTWLLYPALQGANMFDFHSLTLVAPVIVWLVLFLYRKATLAYYLTFAVALLVREDVSLLLCFIAFWSLLLKDPWSVRTGWITLFVSVAYFVLAKAVFMSAPGAAMRGTQMYSFGFYYASLIPNDTGLGELIRSLLTNPAFVAQIAVGGEQKMQFLLLLFAPLAFLPFVAKPGRFALIYGLLFCLLATRSAVYSIHFQYTCTIFPIAFCLTALAFERIEHHPKLVALGLPTWRWVRALVVFCFVSTLLLCWKFGGVIDNSTFRAGFVAPNRSLNESERKRYEWIEEAAAMIPKDASVGASRRLGPHVSNRSNVRLYPSQGKFDYLFIERNRVERERKDFHRNVLKQGAYKELTRHGNLSLYQRTK